MITFPAYASWIPASSAVIALTSAPAPATTAAAVSPVPNPPTMMLPIERFMASAMSLVRIPPDAPTRAPAIISAQLPITKPAIATALPVNAFRSEITTGMSAPPMGITMSTPNTRDATTTIHSPARLGVASTYPAAARPNAASTTLTTRAPGNETGADVITPWSLPAAMIDPENVTDPMITSSSVVIVVDSAGPTTALATRM